MVVFTAVNDPYVMTEWGVVSNAIGKVRREAEGRSRELGACLESTVSADARHSPATATRLC